MNTNRAGKYVKTVNGFSAYVPNPLPPVPRIQFSSELVSLLSRADQKLGRLDGIVEFLPNPDLFVAMYVQKEALLSSQIEGTQASFVDVLEAAKDIQDRNSDAHEVINYMSAMEYAFDRLIELPLSLRLIRETHKVLLQSGRGSAKTPGEFRASQNWIGPSGSTPDTAVYIPPSVDDMKLAMGDLEKFLHTEDNLPALVKIALVHAQFETIHPFLDGNGRMGRLLITFWLTQQGILTKPLLYLSYYFKLYRNEYYEKLMDIRFKGAWEEWLEFFLGGVIFVADEAVASAKEIIELKSNLSQQLTLRHPSSNNHQRLLEYLFTRPMLVRYEASEALSISQPTANRIVDEFVNEGILSDLTPGQSRNKRFLFSKYMSIIEKGTTTDTFLSSEY